MLSPQQLEQALHLQAKAARKWTLLRHKKPVLLGEILVRHGMVRPEQLEAAVGAQLEGMSSTLSLGGMRRIGEYLVAQSLITPEQLQRGLGRQAELRRQGQALPLGEVLVHLGYIERDQLRQALLQMHEEFTFVYR